MRGELGFTVVELVVSIVLVVVLITLVFVFNHPRDYTPLNRDATRWKGVAELVQGLNRAVAHGVSLPQSLTDKPALIASGSSNIDLCALLVPNYLKDVPLDPQQGWQFAVDTCRGTDDAPAAYSTGYTIKRDKDGMVMISAPYAEGGAPITLGHKY